MILTLFNSKTCRSLFFICVLSLPVSWGLFSEYLINGHDAMGGLMRAVSMQKYSHEGQFLVRWASDLNFGYGYPMFNFYPPFFYFVTTFLSHITHNIIFTINLSCLLFLVLSGCGMYFWAREFWGHKGGVLSAVAYTYAPYHIQDLYVRGAYAEFTSFAIFPILLLSILKISQNFKRRYFILAVISTFMLSTAHNIMSLLFFPIAFCYLLLLTMISFQWKRGGVGLLALIIGLMMSAFFWLPAIIEKQYLNLSFLLSMRYDFHQHFITLKQLFRFPWDGSSDSDGISFQIGLFHVLLSILLVIITVFCLRVRRFLMMQIVFFFSLGIFCIYLMLPGSYVIWEKISILQFVQMPWRLLAIISFICSFMVGGIMWISHDKPFRDIFFVVFVFIFMATAARFYLQIKHSEINNNNLHDISSYVFLGEGEYTPKWVKTPMMNLPVNKFEIIVGRGSVERYQRVSSVKYLADIKTDQDSLICFHTYYFPGWQVDVDGKRREILFNNQYGLILFGLKPGKHQVAINFQHTFIRSTAVWISWLGLSSLFFLSFFALRKKGFI